MTRQFQNQVQPIQLGLSGCSPLKKMDYFFERQALPNQVILTNQTTKRDLWERFSLARPTRNVDERRLSLVGLPLPDHLLQESGRLMAEQRKGIRFRLISSWAINKEHRPTTEFERTGLMKILENPDRPYTAITTEGKARIFQALYPDKAVSQHCADCHNVHPKSLKRDFKAGDVMGGLLVTIALPQEGKPTEDKRLSSMLGVGVSKRQPVP